jgi:hypothetical protein
MKVSPRTATESEVPGMAPSKQTLVPSLYLKKLPSVAVGLMMNSPYGILSSKPEKKKFTVPLEYC